MFGVAPGQYGWGCTHVHRELFALVDNLWDDLGSTWATANNGYPFADPVKILFPCSCVRPLTLEGVQSLNTAKFGSIKGSNGVDDSIRSPLLDVSGHLILSLDVPDKVAFIPCARPDIGSKLGAFLQSVVVCHLEIEVLYLRARRVDMCVS